MDQPTLDYYNENAFDLVKQYNSIESPLSLLLPVLFPKGRRVLDVGCGSGRDMAHMMQLGLDVYGVEPGNELIKQAVNRFPQLNDRIFLGGLPRLPENLPCCYDGIILSAVIMHIPENILFDSAFALKKLLNPKGLLVISHCPRRDVELIDNRGADGRLFVLRSSQRIQLLFEELGFQKRHLFSNNDKLGREGIEWETLVLEYSGKAQTDSVDRIGSKPALC